MDLRKMSEDDLHTHFEEVRAELNLRMRNRQAAAAQLYRPGDVVSFDTPKHGRVVMRVDRVNAKSLSGTETGPLGQKWKVAPTFCKLVEQAA